MLDQGSGRTRRAFLDQIPGREKEPGKLPDSFKIHLLKTVVKLQRLMAGSCDNIKLLLFWPVFGLAFLALERFRPHAAYHVMHCALDDAIPFSEWALIPYLLWFVYLIGALAYLKYGPSEKNNVNANTSGVAALCG